MHSTQSVNTGGALAANKSARAMLGASRHRTAARVRAPTPGRRQSPFQRCLLCGTRAWAIGCAPPRQPRTAKFDLSADAPHQATARTSHGTAAAMRSRISGPSITHSSNKAWRGREIWARLMALLVGQWNGCCRVDRIACAGVENRGENRKSTKRCGLDRLNLIYAKRAVARPPNGLIRYPRLCQTRCADDWHTHTRHTPDPAHRQQNLHAASQPIRIDAGLATEQCLSSRCAAR